MSMEDLTMKVPIVIFKEMSLEENIDIIKWAISENNDSLDVYKYTIDYFPELAVLNKNDSEKIIHNKIKEVVTKDYNTYYEKIKNEVKRYNEIWRKYNDNYFKALSSYLNITWPKDHMKVYASVGLIPVFPRYLNEFRFAISTNLKEEKIIETTAHETCHFLWFQKWHELYPSCPKRHYDSPYLPWRYSEMVVDPILNASSISNIFNNKFIEKAYDSFYNLKYDNKYVMDSLKEIYKENISIEDKIKKGYKYVRKAYKKQVILDEQ